MMKNIKLNNGVEIPAIGLGTWQSTEKEVYEAVKHALQVGYRHIDTAAIYGNEKEVGQGIVDSGVAREDIFLTSKVWNTVSTYDETVAAFEKSLELLQTDYLDLYLIHWPGDEERFLKVWEAMEDLYEAKKIRAIGVSNFNFHHMYMLLSNCKVVPVVNQIECHVKVQNVALQSLCHANDIYLQAYAPMMSWKVKELADIKPLAKMATKYGKSASQICLRWLVQRDIVALPKSVNPKRIEANIDLFDFELSDDEMLQIRHLNDGTKLFPDPDNIDFGFLGEYSGEAID